MYVRRRRARPRRTATCVLPYVRILQYTLFRRKFQGFFMETFGIKILDNIDTFETIPPISAYIVEDVVKIDEN